MIVLPDADMELAADAAVSAGYGSAGERCMAICVIVAVGNAADKLVPLMKERIAKLKVGDGLEAGDEMGPLINKAHRDKVARLRRSRASPKARRSSPTAATLKVAGRPNGFFLGPCLFDNVKPRDDDLQGRDLRPGARRRRASRRTTRRSSW